MDFSIQVSNFILQFTIKRRRNHADFRDSYVYFISLFWITNQLLYQLSYASIFNSARL